MKKIMKVLGVILLVIIVLVLIAFAAKKWYDYNLIFNGKIAQAKFTDMAQVFVSALGLFGVAVAAIYQIRKHSLDRNAHFADRFSKAVAHLESESHAVRCGATYEFKKLAIESKEDREMILKVLSEHVKDRITRTAGRPERDVFLAAETLTFLYEQFNMSAELAKLREGYWNEPDLSGISLRGANLTAAKLWETNLKGADLRGATLTAAQLLEAHIDDTTLLDPNLRAEYERLKAEQDAN